MKDYSKEVKMKCPVCGRESFEYDDYDSSDDAIIKCTYCNNEFTRKELIDKNQIFINDAIDDTVNEMLKDLNIKFKHIK